MRREKKLNRSLLLLAIMSIMLFAMTITASAAQAVTGIKQTDAHEGSVDIEWNMNPNQYYRVLYSTSKNGKYYRINNYTSSYDTADGDAYIYNLNAGATYYVKVESYIRDDNWDYHRVAVSAPCQVVTTPKDVEYKKIKQTAGTAKSVTVKWASVPGATGYKVTLEGDTSLKKKFVTGTKVTMPASAGLDYKIKVQAYRKCSATGYVAMADEATKSGIYAAPLNPQNIASKDNISWDPTSSNKITIDWDRNSYYSSNYSAKWPDGYQMQIISIDGKKRLYTTKPLSSYGPVTINTPSVRKAINNKGFRVKMRTYVKTDSGLTIWSKWTAAKVIVPTAKIRGAKALSGSAAKIYWSKVSNAKYYVVYYNSNTEATNGGIWKKKKVSANTTSFTIRGLKYYRDFGFYVVPSVKVGKKTYTPVDAKKNAYKTYIKKVYY